MTTTSSSSPSSFAIGIPYTYHFTNGYHQDLQNNDNNSAFSHNHHLLNTSSNKSCNNLPLVVIPSFKLSTLMKSNNATDIAKTIGKKRNSPSFKNNFTSSLPQKHKNEQEEQQFQLFSIAHRQQQYKQCESVKKSSFIDDRYQHPVIIDKGEVIVGGVGIDTINTKQEKSLEDQREEAFSNHNEEKLLSQNHRARSMSSDDLTVDWSQCDNNAKLFEWRDVAKIRRSFQYPKSTSYKSLPHDISKNAGNVSRIRDKLENRREVNETQLTDLLNQTSSRIKKLDNHTLFKNDITQKTTIQQPTSLQYQPKVEENFTTNSLENKTKSYNANSSDWHFRKKINDFENMNSSDNSKFRLKTSTDSGIDSSGDLSNWSPIEKTPLPLSSIANPMIIQKTAIILKNNEQDKNALMTHNDENVDLDEKHIEIKRHSIAVDKTEFVSKAFEGKSSFVHLNGFSDETKRLKKRVEFCKTEVHFAAESGKVNIVETDGKPPPTNNFRRRRRSYSNSSNTASLNVTASHSAVIHFGDDKKVLLQKESELNYKSNVITPIPIKSENNSIVSSFPNEIENESNFDEISLKGILKNKPIKPKTYHLGENIESSENLWGIRLKPVAKYNQDIRKDFDGDSYKVIEKSPTTKVYLGNLPSFSSISSSPTTISNQFPQDNLKSTSLIIKTMQLTQNTDLTDNSYEQDKKFDRMKTQQTKFENEINIHENITEIIPLNRKIIVNDNNEDKIFEESKLPLVPIDCKKQIINEQIDESSLKAQYHINKMKFTKDKTNLLSREIKRPIAISKIHVIESSNSINNQLLHLEKINNLSGHESDDSAKADEEVNHIFGGIDVSLDEQTNKISENCKYNEIKNIQTEKFKEFPKTNVTCIKLRSPSLTIAKIVPTEVVTRKLQEHIPKLKTVSPVKIQQSTLENENIKTTTNIQKDDKQFKSIRKIDSIKNEKSLKVGSGGARELRDHELLYFGIKINKNQEIKDKKSESKNNSHKNHNINQNNDNKVLENETKYRKLKCAIDKPDILRHSPNTSKVNITLQGLKREYEKSCSPIYENLKKFGSYNRKKDVKCDEVILNEVDETTDHALKIVKEPSTNLKEKNLQKSAKTHRKIGEKSIHQLSNLSKDRKESKAIQISHAIDNSQRVCYSNRLSSSSPVENLKMKIISSKPRTRSNKSPGKIECANIRSTKELSSSSLTRDNSINRYKSENHEIQQRKQQIPSSNSHHNSSLNNHSIHVSKKSNKSHHHNELTIKDKNNIRPTLVAKLQVEENRNSQRYTNHNDINVTEIEDHSIKSNKSNPIIEKYNIISSRKKKLSPVSTIDYHQHHHHYHHSQQQQQSNHKRHSKLRAKSSGTMSSTSSLSKHKTLKEHKQKKN